VKRVEEFDVGLTRLGYLKSQRLEAEVREVEAQEQAKRSAWLAANAKEFDYGPYEQLVSNLKDGELPEIPYAATNAIVINLFCID
jgi:hypothetical protein